VLLPAQQQHLQQTASTAANNLTFSLLLLAVQLKFLKNLFVPAIFDSTEQRLDFTQFNFNN
jgi:hypothetical protein